MIYGAAIAGSSGPGGRSRPPSRAARAGAGTRSLTFASIAVIVGIGLLVAFVVGVIVALVGATIAGVPTDGMRRRDDPRRVARAPRRGWLAHRRGGALGFAIATLARSQLAGIGVGIALYFGETVRDALPARHRQVPAVQRREGGVRTSAGAPAGRHSSSRASSRTWRCSSYRLWLVGALVVTAIFTERAEITG